ncbi:MAG: Ppx/GppA family phosphatase [Acidimicrobiia bacterium]
MRAAAIDIGSNSVRLLIVEDDVELHRSAVVTGLGRGVSQSGLLSDSAVDETIEVLEGFGGRMDDAAVEAADAVATAAARAAGNTAAFLDAAEQVLGFRPRVISGLSEARLSFVGATSDLEGEAWQVVDIGGASTECVGGVGEGLSLDVGSVSLTDRFLGDRPLDPGRLDAARRYVADIVGTVGSTALSVVGVAGTWTSLAGLILGSNHPSAIHHTEIGRADLERLLDRLAALSVEETAALPGLDPARAPVILGGAIVAAVCLDTLHADHAVVSVHDLLDGLIAEILNRPR